MAEPLSPQREAEIREWEAELGKGKTAQGVGPYAALRDALAELDRVRGERDAYCDRVDTLTAVAKGNKRHVQEMYADLQKAHAARDELASRARRVAESHQRFIDDTSDPGSEAFGAQHELTTFLSRLSAGEPMDVDHLSRFSVTPAEVHAFLAKHLAEDVHLRYQQAVGGRAVGEAAKDVRMESHTTQAGAYYRNGMAFSADHIDPLKGGGPYPSELIRFGETGGAS